MQESYETPVAYGNGTIVGPMVIEVGEYPFILRDCVIEGTLEIRAKKASE